jgi:S-formylglutathione hydrolase FrmB
MALLTVNFFSYVLGMDTSMAVLLPEKRGQKPAANPDKKYPVLYLLHGHSDDHTSWMRKSTIELMVRDEDLIVVMPTTHRAFYTNSRHGHQYFDFMAEELPTVVSNFFPASTKREDTYAAGLSMGGYGSLKLALTYPERYAAAGSLSGALYPLAGLKQASDQKMFTSKDFVDNFYNIFGSIESYQDSVDDLEFLAQKCQESGKILPKLFMTVGKDDPIYNNSKRFSDFMKEQCPNFDLYYEEDEGSHNWDFWNRKAPVLLRHQG